MAISKKTFIDIDSEVKYLKSSLITFQKRYKKQIDEMFAIMDGLEGAVYISDFDKYNILRVNKYVYDYFGKDVIGKKCYLIFHDFKDKPCPFCTNNRLLIKGKPAPPITWEYYNKKTKRWYHCIDKAIFWPDKKYVKMEVAIDITKRKEAEIALHESERFLNTIFNSIQDPFGIIDKNFCIIKVNESYAKMRGLTIEQLIGKRCYEVLRKRKNICDNCLVQKTFETAKPCTKEKLIHTTNGSQMWIEIYTYPILDKHGNVSNVIEYTRDITKRKRIETERDILIDKLQTLSNTDELTGLYNRRALIEKLGEEIKRAKRYNSELSLIICDLDFFKEINDSYGHDIGDRVLEAIATRIKESLRDIDIVGRYGGDEFLIILPETNLKGAKQIAERIRQLISKVKVYINNSIKIKTTASLGIAKFNPIKEDIKSFIKRADNALYMAKGKGRNRVYYISHNNF